MTPTSALLIVNYGSHELIAANLERTTVPSDMAVVVVDNRTTDEERTAMRSLAERHGWQIVEPSTNLGFGGGMNEAARVARRLGAQTFVLLNPDASVESDGLARLVADVTEHKDTLVAPLVLRPDGSHFSSQMELDWDAGTTRRLQEGRQYARSAPWVSGACFAIHDELWNRVGGFDEDYFLYWEDVDFSVRVAEVGGRLRVEHDVRAVHSPGGTQESGRSGRGKSPVYNYYNTRNRLVFAAQHLDAERQRAWRRGSIAAARDILLRSGRRALLNPFRTIIPALRGTLAGLRYLRRAARDESSAAGVSLSEPRA